MTMSCADLTGSPVAEVDGTVVVPSTGVVVSGCVPVPCDVSAGLQAPPVAGNGAGRALGRGYRLRKSRMRETERASQNGARKKSARQVSLHPYSPLPGCAQKLCELRARRSRD